MSAALYTALNARAHEIRLIRLHPRRRDSTVQCELFIVSLDHAPPYEALSYVWGPSKYQYSVVLNGSTVCVTDNLYRALCRLQPLAGTRLLWIDQLCINQSSTDERGQQVALMGRIYSNSHQTLLWLGEEACVDPLDVPDDQIKVPKTRPCTWTWVKGDSEGITSVGSYRPLIQAHSGGKDQSEHTGDYIYLVFSLIADLANLKRLDDIQALRSDGGPGKETLRALWFVMHRPWWRRVWTLQECILPPKALLVYGRVVAPFEMFLLAASSYTNQLMSVGSESQRLPRHNATILRHFVQTLTDIDKYRQTQLSGRKINLVSALRSFRVREATDDRDKVYGLLGLDINWHGQRPLYPNYRLETPQVYRDTTLKLIQGTQSLGVLINSLDRLGDSRKQTNVRSMPQPPPLPASAPPELQALMKEIESWKTELKNEPYFIDVEASSFPLPSWVPDWSSPISFEVLSRYEQAELYSAAGSTTATVSLTDESILVLKGVEVDTVRWSSQIMAYTGGEDRSSLFHDWQTFSKDAFAYSLALAGNASVSSKVRVPLPLEDAFWRTLCGDTVVGSGSDSTVSAFRRVTPANYQDFLFWCSTQEPRLLPGSFTLSDDIGLLSQDTVADRDSSGDIRSSVEPAIRAATTMRRLFVTRKGFLGLGPPQTVGGEKIFVLYGGHAPFVLRHKAERMTTNKQASCYELVGDCYVHGIMDGEAMNWNLPETEIHLL